MNYVLEYREPGKRPNATRTARRKVSSLAEAKEWMNANKATAFLPASVLTTSWKREVVAILWAPSA